MEQMPNNKTASNNLIELIRRKKTEISDAREARLQEELEEQLAQELKQRQLETQTRLNKLRDETARTGTQRIGVHSGRNRKPKI